MLNEWLLERGFVTTYEVEGIKSIASLVDTSPCGIYFLHFANSQYYIGLAKNVAKRYVQHRKTHTDIVRISFKPVEKNNLKIVESSDIEFFKSKILLRNIDQMEDLIMERKFDRLVGPDFSQLFLNELNYNDTTGLKYRNEKLQANYKYRGNFQNLIQQSFYSELITTSRRYLRLCVPAPVKTEYDFWSVTCFAVKKDEIVIRLNIYQQEVFTVYILTSEDGIISLEYVFHLAKGPLVSSVNGRTQKGIIQNRCPSAEFDEHFHRTGGNDQMSLAILSADINRLFNFTSFMRSARLHNFRLMRKGTNMNRVSHCMDLAEEMLKPITG